jgi:hypothetical protein
MLLVKGGLPLVPAVYYGMSQQILVAKLRPLSPNFAVGSLASDITRRAYCLLQELNKIVILLSMSYFWDYFHSVDCCHVYEDDEMNVVLLQEPVTTCAY